jgi:hypothetical protein
VTPADVDLAQAWREGAWVGALAGLLLGALALWAASEAVAAGAL